MNMIPVTKKTSTPTNSHFPHLQIYRKQVIKQADLVLAMHAGVHRPARRDRH